MTTAALTTEPAAPGADLLDEAGARALTATICTHLEALDGLLLTAWRGRVWTALAYPSWEAWVAAELGTVRLRLPVEQRRAVAAAWRAHGMSTRAIATGLGVSKGTVGTDLAATPVGDGLAVVVSLDGRRRPATRPSLAEQATRPAPKQQTALAVIAAAGEHGVTVPELMRQQRWSWSQTSACTSRLNRARDDDGVRMLERLAERRGGHAVYVLLEYVADRSVLQPGQRLPRST